MDGRKLRKVNREEKGRKLREKKSSGIREERKGKCNEGRGGKVNWVKRTVIQGNGKEGRATEAKLME